MNLASFKDKVDNLPGKWSGGSYCILANGNCPDGFTRYAGHMKAINMWICVDDAHLTEVVFGDSNIKRYPTCASNNAFGEITITACCK